MRGSVARALRKEVGFEPDDDRSYQEIEFVVKRQIYQFGSDENGLTDLKLVWRDVPAFLIECTSGSRKMYKYLKRKWTNLEYEASFSQLPSLADLENVANTITDDKDLTKEMIDSKKKTTGQLK